jgi:catechol 2,3-dioxygenase-like lactoylglutathione lyase family enzyme
MAVLALVTLLVRDYDEALAFYVDVMGFRCVEDTPMPAQDKRWVVVAPPGARETGLLLARASTPAQLARVGDQTGGRVAFFLHTDDIARDLARVRAGGVTVVRGPAVEPYGTVAVLRDLYGNLWDLIEPAPAPGAADGAADASLPAA